MEEQKHLILVVKNGRFVEKDPFLIEKRLGHIAPSSTFVEKTTPL